MKDEVKIRSWLAAHDGSIVRDGAQYKITLTPIISRGKQHDVAFTATVSDMTTYERFHLLAKRARTRAHNGVFKFNHKDALARRNRASRLSRLCPEGFAQTAIYSATKRAKRRGVPCTITQQDITDTIPSDGCCPALGGLLTFGAPLNDNSASLDCIYPAKGYVLGNIAVISFLANTIKQRATTEQVLLVAAWMEGKQ